MKANWIDFLVLGLYVAGLVAVSWYTRKKNKSNKYIVKRIN